MKEAAKYRIYPTDIQKIFLAKSFGAARAIYNMALARRQQDYLTNGKGSSYYKDCKKLTELKKTDGYGWLNEVNSQCLQMSLKNLETAYIRFYRGLSEFPSYHKKHNAQCIRIPQNFSVKDNSLYIPKLKTGIEINLHKPLPANITCCSVSKTPTDKYYVSFLHESEIKKLKKISKSVGIDLGIKTLVTTSDGIKIENPKHLCKREKEIIHAQKQFDRKKQRSKNRKKQGVIVAKLHEKVANKRKDLLHKTSKMLIDENQVIIAESLSVVNMMKNHCLAKAIQDTGWGELVRQLKYKSEMYGRTFYQIDRFYPSSKTCHNCKFILDKLPLNVRGWDCPSCKQHNDRDLNAAKNIRDQGLSDLDALSGLGTNSDNKQKLVEALEKLSRSKKQEVPAFMQE